MRSNPHVGVALVHDYLTQRGGAERVVADLCATFPEAPLFTSLYEPSLTFPEFEHTTIHASGLNRLALVRRHHRLALPLYAPAFSRLTIDADVTICSSSGWAHGARVSGAKLVYCHAPARWLYQRDRYLAASGMAQRIGLRLLSPSLTKFDQRAAKSADRYVVNSTATKAMVLDAYGIDATVIHPPIAIDTSGPREPVSGIDEGFLLVVARLLGYKNVGLIVEAARRTGQPVVVVGDGPLREELEAKQVPHVRFLGRVDDATLRWCYANCAAHVAMSYEDFGLSPIEAAGFGKPTIALGAGGYLDTVIDEQTGIFVRAATVDALVDSLEQFATMRFSSDAIIAHATTFSKERFADAIRREVEDLRR